MYPRNEIPYQDWISDTVEKNYDNYRSDGPGPVEIEAREKYKHENISNHYIDQHGRDFSFRAKKEMNNLHNQSQSIIKSYAGVGPKSYVRSDESILDEIFNLLTKSEFVDASDITVDVHDRVVKLHGSVTERYNKYYVEDLVENVPGILDIQNDIKVRK